MKRTQIISLFLAFLLALSACGPVSAAVQADAFAELLKDGPLTVSTHDYGNFEKVGALGTELPRTDEQITTVLGDIILYQGNTVANLGIHEHWNNSADKQYSRNLGKNAGIELIYLEK